MLQLGDSKREKRKTVFVCWVIFIKFIPKTQKHVLYGGKVCLPTLPFCAGCQGEAMSDSWNDDRLENSAPQTCPWCQHWPPAALFTPFNWLLCWALKRGLPGVLFIFQTVPHLCFLSAKPRTCSWYEEKKANTFRVRHTYIHILALHWTGVLNLWSSVCSPVTSGQ